MDFFHETTTPDSSKASTPADVHESCSSLSNSQESIMEQSTELPLVVGKASMSKEGLETVDTEVCRLKQLVEEQQLIITEYKHLLSATDKRITKLLVNNQQLVESLAEAEMRLTTLTTEDEVLRYQLVLILTWRILNSNYRKSKAKLRSYENRIVTKSRSLI